MENSEQPLKTVLVYLILLIISPSVLYSQDSYIYYTKDSLAVLRTLRNEEDRSRPHIQYCEHLRQINNSLYYDSTIIDGVRMGALILFENDLIFSSIGPDVTYFKDNVHVYYRDHTIDPADHKTFMVLENDFAKDQYFVFYAGNILRKADPKSFKYIGNNYAKDKEHFYFYGERVTGDEVVYLQRLYNSYQRIDFNIKYTIESGEVYYKSNKMKCDANSFQSLSDGYAIDRNNAYYNGEKIAGADPKSFKRTDLSEENHLYKYLQIDEKYLHSPFAKDKKQYYYFGKKVK